MPQFVIAYDIGDDHRRARVARLLQRYGQRVQKSVFIALLDRHEHGALRRELGAILRRSDLVEMFPLDGRAADLHVAWNADPNRYQCVQVIGG